MDQVRVSIDYDGASAYGIPIRSHEACRYPIIAGKAALDQRIDEDQQMTKEQQRIYNELMATAKAAMEMSIVP